MILARAKVTVDERDRLECAACRLKPAENLEVVQEHATSDTHVADARAPCCTKRLQSSLDHRRPKLKPHLRELEPVAAAALIGALAEGVGKVHAGHSGGESHGVAANDVVQSVGWRLEHSTNQVAP